MLKLPACSKSSSQWTGVLNLPKKDKKRKKRAQEKKAQRVGTERRPNDAARWRALVQVRTAHKFPNFAYPWRAGACHDSCSTGLVVNRTTGLCITTAGAVHYAEPDEAGDRCQVALALPDRPRPVPAYVAAVSHAADLCLLQTHAPSALRHLEQVQWRTEIPEVGQRVVLAGCTAGPAFGAPSKQAVTPRSEGPEEHASPHVQASRSVLSRIEVGQYSHSGASLLSYQVEGPSFRTDGCFGGGLFSLDEEKQRPGHCLGVIFQRSEFEPWSARYGSGEDAGGVQQTDHARTVACSTHSSSSYSSSSRRDEASISNSCPGSPSNSKDEEQSSRLRTKQRMLRRAERQAARLTPVSVAGGGKQHVHRHAHSTLRPGAPSAPGPVVVQPPLPGAAAASTASTATQPPPPGASAPSTASTATQPPLPGAAAASAGPTATQPAASQMGAASAMLIAARPAASTIRGAAEQGSMLHVVPASVVAHFLADLRAHRPCCRGPPMPGFRFQTLQASALQQWISSCSLAAQGLTEGRSSTHRQRQHSSRGVTGLLVTAVPGKHCGWEPLHVHDVVTAIDGTAVMADGNAEVRPGLLLSFAHLLASKQADEEVTITVVRRGRILDLVCRLNTPHLFPHTPLPPSTTTPPTHSLSSALHTRASPTLATPQHLFPHPPFHLLGPLACTTLTQPALEQLCRRTAANRAAATAGSWHVPGALKGRVPRVKDSGTGQHVGWVGGMPGELWGGSNLVPTQSDADSGRVANRMWGGVLARSSSLVHARSDVGGVSSQHAFKKRPPATLTHHVAADLRDAEECGVQELVVATEVLMPMDELSHGTHNMPGLSEPDLGLLHELDLECRRGLWPTPPDLLLRVNGQRVLSLRHCAQLCAPVDGSDHKSFELELEFASGHITRVGRAEAARAAALVASAFAMPASTLW